MLSLKILAAVIVRLVISGTATLCSFQICFAGEGLLLEDFCLCKLVEILDWMQLAIAFLQLVDAPLDL